MEKQDRILVAGSRGLVGSALLRRLLNDGFENVLAPPRSELDLTDQAKTDAYFKEHRPSYVLLAAAKVGGILANDTFPAQFIRDNLLIQTNAIHAAYEHGAKKLLFLGSSCIYPKHCPQPMKEEHLLTGPLEPTNSPYAIAKIAGIEMCHAYRREYDFSSVCLMPTNLYGPGDNFDLQNSHVLPALLRKMHEAKQSKAPSVTLWGTGSPKREFLHVDDLADACLFVMNTKATIDHSLLNVGCGEDLSIKELAETIQRVVGYEGELSFDTSKPDGTPRKLLDVSRMTALGWKRRIGLEEGVRGVYDWYLKNPPA